jgi:hypothetical protein
MLFDTIHRETGLNLYFRIKDWNTKKVWNRAEGEWQDSPSWENSVVAITETPASSGDYPIELKDALTGSGWLNVIVYKRAGDNPLNSDEIVYGINRPYGSIFGF